MCHTLQLGIRDTFAEVTGVQRVLDICKKLAEYTNRSTIGSDALKKACKEMNHNFTKLQNPNDTRWHSQLTCLESVLKNKLALCSLGGNDDLQFHSLLPRPDQWAMIEGICEVLEPFRELGKLWEADKVPTVNRVVEGLYVRMINLKEWYKNCLLYTSPSPRD